jgi:hypothetical protein
LRRSSLSEILEIDEVNCNIVNHDNDPVTIAFNELYARQRSQQIDTIGRITKLNDLIGNQEIFGG